jgi:hypothetical protein
VCYYVLQVYRGTWTNIDIAAKEYLAVDDYEATVGTEAAMERARVSGFCRVK